MRLIFILGSNVVIWVSDSLRTRLIFIFLIRGNVGNSFLCLKRVPSSPPAQACRAYLKRVYVQKKDQINVCLRQWIWAVKRVWEATVFFGYHIMLQTAMGRDRDGLFIILARARLERVFFSIFEEI